MNQVWKIRILLFVAICLMLFGDYFSYGTTGSVNEKTHENLDTLQAAKRKDNRGIGYALREACLPKLLCEMAAKPWSALTDKERELLSLIKHTTMSLSSALSPTKWHYAAHMGQLLRNSDDLVLRCSQLWPECPFSSKKLLTITSKITFR